MRYLIHLSERADNGRVCACIHPLSLPKNTIIYSKYFFFLTGNFMYDFLSDLINTHRFFWLSSADNPPVCSELWNVL